jgi:aromatic ring-cleaving dioxygenase
MGHFTIKLPENKLGNVRYGIVRKAGIRLNLFSKQKVKPEPKIAYKVIVADKKKKSEVYWLYKSKEGKWTTDIEGRKDIDSYIHIYLKYFISEIESGQL